MLQAAQTVAEEKWGFEEDTYSEISSSLTGFDLLNKILEEKYNDFLHPIFYVPCFLPPRFFYHPLYILIRLKPWFERFINFVWSGTLILYRTSVILVEFKNNYGEDRRLTKLSLS